MNSARTAIVCLLFLAICFFGRPANAAEPGVRQVVLVLWHGLDWEHIKDFRCSAPLSLGIMNTRSGGGDEPSASYLSIGAGARAVGFARAASFFSAEQARDVYMLRTGHEPALFVQPDIALIRASQKVNYTVKPGALGTAFHRAATPIRALGNSDGEERGSWAALTAMDEWGRVWAGQIGDGPVVKDTEYPFGLRTDYEYLEAAVLTATERLIIVDLGDPFRFDQYQKFLSTEQGAVVETRLVGEALSFVERLAELKNQGTVILIISPHPGRAKAELGQWLTPVLCIGAGEGLLTSGTTRWPGLITNMDVAPTVLALLNFSHNEPFLGRQAVTVPHQDSHILLAETAKRLEQLTLRRGPVLRVVILLQILLYCSSLLVLIVNRPPVRLLRSFQLLLIVFLALPLGFVLLPASPLLVLVCGLAVVFLEFTCRQLIVRIGIISGVTALAIAADVSAGSPLLRFSYLGYDPIGGARFYGLGNEFMGFLVGSAVLCWSVICQKNKKLPYLDWIGLFVYAAVLIVIGAPALGTNVGGAICAVFAFGYTWDAFRRKKAGLGSLLALVAAAAAILSLFMLVDQANPVNQQSHIGQTVALIRRDGLLSIEQIITRKLAMNFKLLRHSVWSRALLVAIAVMGASFIWPSTFISWLKNNYPFIAMGMKGTVIGSLAALIFNDSGVVAAATCLYFASSTLLLLALELKHDLDAPETHI